jgi:XrtJ-associated TM-motif-TM protein
LKIVQRILFAAIVVLFFSLRAHAQGGCVDSPEAPTDVLLLVGSTGMIFGSSVVMKALRRYKKR